MKKFLSLSLVLLIPLLICAQSSTRFEAVILGCGGGPEDHNLSAYLIGEANKGEFLCLDAGTLLSGIQLSHNKNSFPWFQATSNDLLSIPYIILQHHIKAYLISHAHLDHVSGLTIASTDDSPKTIYALPATIDDISNHLFNWRLWPNFGNEGHGFTIGKYQYQRLIENVETQIAGTAFHVSAFPLSHGNPYQSTAFLIRCNDAYILYCGDTGADAIEDSENLDFLWTAIAPLIKNKSLQAIFIECSYSNQQPKNKLYGHLTPELLLKEFHRLALKVDSTYPEKALEDLAVVITHIKPSGSGSKSPEKIIARELNAGNNLKLNFMIAEQGSRIVF